MLPEKLVIQAFGPYVEKQEIDFSQFPHLFLIRGETGSGKTMILDAMTYALYGKSSGGQREDFESMRSRFANDETPTLVDFQFQVHGHHYRFVRKIEVKEKRNKEKAYKQSIDAGEVIDGVCYPFFENPKLRNVEEKAIELIGLQHEQLIQVMVLPQGKFERLLTSKSEEKQEILRTLFQMEKWESLSQFLSEKANQMKKEMEAKKQKIDTLLESVQMEKKEDIVARCERLHQDAMEYQQQLQKVQQEQTVLQEEYRHQVNVHELWKEQKSLSLKEQRLLSQKEDMITLQRKIEDYHQVEKVLPYFQSMIQYQTMLKKRAKEMEQCEVEFASAKEEMKLLPQYQKDVEEIKKRIQELQLEENNVVHAMQAYQQLLALQTSIQQVEESIGKITKQLETQQQRFIEVQQEHQKLYDDYLNTSALQLRAVLKEDEPCPVCGSLQHPFTEVISQQYVDVMKLKHVKETMEKLQEQTTQIQMKLAKETSHKDGLWQQYQKDNEQYQSMYANYHQICDLTGFQTIQMKYQEENKLLEKKGKSLDAKIQQVQIRYHQSQQNFVKSKQEHEAATKQYQESIQDYEQHKGEGMEESVLLN